MAELRKQAWLSRKSVAARANDRSEGMRSARLALRGAVAAQAAAVA
jgi:hypothetical protein